MKVIEYPRVRSDDDWENIANMGVSSCKFGLLGGARVSTVRFVSVLHYQTL
jgi:hypothetical protein